MTEPTGYTALDLVGFTDKGTYNAATAYVKNDLVHYSGDIWRCLIDDTTNITPVEGTNWTLFIEAPTNAIEGIIAPVETNPVTNSYAVGRLFIYDDKLYIVLTAITAGDTLVAYEDDPSNANIQLADPVETQLLNFKEKAYSTDDSAETTLASDDLVPFYDTSAAAKKKMTVANMIGQTVSNPNLLDNPWFTVNQRNFSGNSTRGDYGFDRWKNIVRSQDGTITSLENGGFRFDAITDQYSYAIQQQILDKDLTSQLLGKTLTMSLALGNIVGECITKIVVSDGTSSLPQTSVRIIDSGNITLQGNEIVSYTFTLPSTIENDNISIYVWGGRTPDVEGATVTSMEFQSVKLELGSVSTLAMDTVPNYQQELAKCQRYFQRIAQNTPTDALCIAVYRSGSVLRAVLPLAVPMRANPAVTVNGTVSDYTNSGMTMARIGAPVTSNGAIGINFNITKSGITWSDGVAKAITPDDAGFYIDLSADL